MLNVPVGWEVKQLGDVAVINPGINKSMSHMGSGVLYVTVQDLYSGDSIDIKRLGRIRLSTQEVDSYALQPRDIIFGKSSVKREGIAYPNIFRGALEPVVCTGFSYMVRALPELADADFLLHALRWSPTRKWLIEHSQASALTNINKAISDAIPITLPPLEEQQRIGTILSDMDAHANAMARLLAKKKAVKAAMAEELLTGKRRLEGFSGAWEVKSFSDVLDRLNVKTYQIQTNEYQKTGKIPVIDQGQKFIAGFSNREDKCFRCEKEGVIVFGDHTCVVKFIDFDFQVGADGTQILRGKYGQDTRFHAHQLQHRGVETTGYNRHFKILKEYNFFVPPLPEQTAIATILSDMDADIHALAKKLEKHRKLKEAMAHQLLTGAIRV